MLVLYANIVFKRINILLILLFFLNREENEARDFKTTAVQEALKGYCYFSNLRSDFGCFVYFFYYSRSSSELSQFLLR